MKAKHMRTCDKAIACPFFKAHGGKEIRCEAPVDDANVRLLFGRYKEFYFQRKLYCERKYERCDLYRCVMMNKYGEE